MAYSKNHNIVWGGSGTNTDDFLWPLKEALVAGGLWSVIGSGDGISTYEFRGATGGAGTGSGGQWDVWEVQGDSGNQFAWILFEDPQGRQMLILGKIVTFISDYFTLAFDYNGNYNSTGVNATTPPAATADEQLIHNTRASQLPFQGTSAGWFSIFAQDEEINGVSAFHIVAYRGTDTKVNMLGYFPITDVVDPTIELEPWLFLETNNGNVSTYEAIGTAGERFLANGSRSVSIMEAANTSLSSGTVDYPMIISSVVFGTTTSINTRYTRGIGYGFQTNSHRIPPMDFPNVSSPDASGITYLFFEYFAIWWDDAVSPTLPSVSSGTPVVVDTGFLSFGEGASGGGDVTPPVISITTPAGPLASRTAPLVFDVSDDTAVALTTVLVNFPTLGITECAYHNGSFRAPYTGSTFAAPTFTLTRTGGWPADPTLDVSAVDTSGNIQS